jgi:Lrp/AsnC family transcriptional regulator, leucine-responsive regulatory protein
LDKIDWQIVDMLLRNARVSYSDIGKQLGLGKDSIQRRVKKLNDAGILRTPISILDAKKCGFEGIADFFIRLDIENIQIVEDQLITLPYVLLVGRAIGDYNFYLSSFYRNFEDIKEIISRIKKISYISSYEMICYEKDVATSIIWPFIDDDPNRSIIYKVKSKYTQQSNNAP